ncbi:MAG: zinc finger domain-containing protein [Candidatus Heimdallarchaeaceae archaeon]
MSKEINMPRCISCNKLLSPADEGATRFPCPSCNDVIIVRCKNCRLFGNKYICPKCGFEGP